jgi:hypothetical protein
MQANHNVYRQRRTLAPRVLVQNVAAATARILVLILAVSVTSLVAADVQSPVRAALTFGFLVFAPGFAILDYWNLSRGIFGAVLAVVTSFTLATLLATAQLYTATWSPQGTVVVMSVVTIAAQVLSIMRHHRPTALSTTDSIQRGRAGT